MKKDHRFLWVFVASLIIASCKLADIRTGDLNEQQTATNQKGKELLKAAHIAMGLDQLTNYETYTLEYQEQYYGIGKWINKFNVNPVALTIDFVPRHFIGKVTVNNGNKKGDQFFYNEGKTYYKSAKGKEKESHKIADKWIRAHQYFLEFPLRIQEASIIRYAGDTIVANKKYHLVIASWNTIEPQKDIDQYLIGINKSNNFIDFIQFTVRDFAKFAVSTAKYNSFVEKNGIYFPSNITVHGKKYDSNKIYEMRVQKLTFNKVLKTTITNFKE